MKQIQKDSSTVPHAQAVKTDDRRGRIRIPVRRLPDVLLSSAVECLQAVTLEDVSFDGAALRVKDASQLAVGQKLDIEILKRSMAVVIKYITTAPEGGYRVGVEFIDPHRQDVRCTVKELLES